MATNAKREGAFGGALGAELYEPQPMRINGRTRAETERAICLTDIPVLLVEFEGPNDPGSHVCSAISRCSREWIREWLQGFRADVKDLSMVCQSR